MPPRLCSWRFPDLLFSASGAIVDAHTKADLPHDGVSIQGHAWIRIRHQPSLQEPKSVGADFYVADLLLEQWWEPAETAPRAPTCVFARVPGCANARFLDGNPANLAPANLALGVTGPPPSLAERLRAELSPREQAILDETDRMDAESERKKKEARQAKKKRKREDMTPDELLEDDKRLERNRLAKQRRQLAQLKAASSVQQADDTDDDASLMPIARLDPHTQQIEATYNDLSEVPLHERTAVRKCLDDPDCAAHGFLWCTQKELWRRFLHRPA